MCPVRLRNFDFNSIQGEPKTGYFRDQLLGVVDSFEILSEKKSRNESLKSSFAKVSDVESKVLEATENSINNNTRLLYTSETQSDISRSQFYKKMSEDEWVELAKVEERKKAGKSSRVSSVQFEDAALQPTTTSSLIRTSQKSILKRVSAQATNNGADQIQKRISFISSEHPETIE